MYSLYEYAIATFFGHYKGSPRSRRVGFLHVAIVIKVVTNSSENPRRIRRGFSVEGSHIV